MGNKAFKILIVEDDTALLKVLSSVVEEAGYSATGCTTTAEALSRVRHTEFNLIVLDCVLPKMNGMDLAQNIKKFLPQATLVFMSGILKDKSFINETLQNTGAKHFLIKPFPVKDRHRG